MMDVPQRNADLRRLGCNLQRNESECYQVPGRPPTNTRKHPSSQVPSRMHSQLQRSASNQVPTRAPGSTRNNAPVPFPNSSTGVHTNAGNLPCSAASIPQRYVVKNDVPFETHRSGQAMTKLQNKDCCATTLRSVYGDSLPDGGRYGQQADEEVFVSQSSQVEGARDFRTVGHHDRAPDVRNATGFQKTSSNYINPKLVQKVLESQKQRAQTPVSHLYSGNKEVPQVVSAGQRRTRLEKPEHHSSDTSLSNKMADCRVTDPETVSTGSQKESGYHSGDSVGDRLSENSEPGRNMPWGPTAAQPFSAIPGAPDDVCEHYFLKGDSLMDLCNEQERFGNWQQALNFLNQAIDFFQQATNVPGVSHDNVLRMRLKHNRAVLHRRKLLKQSGSSTEAPTRRLPCTPQEVKERSTADVLPRHHQPICDQFNKVPVGLDYSDDARNRVVGFGRGPPLYPDGGTGNINFAEGGNCENVSLGVGNPDLPDAGLKWTSDDVKDIKIYATLPKNRRRNGGPLVSNTPTINPVQTKLQSEISISCRNEESQHPSANRNASGHRTTDGCDYQHVPNHYRHGGIMHTKEPVPERMRQMPCTDVPRFQESQSHYFRSDDVNARRTGGSTSEQTKFVRF